MTRRCALVARCTHQTRRNHPSRRDNNSLMDESEGLLIRVAMSISNPLSGTLSMFETRLDRFPDKPCSGVGHVFTLGGRLLSRCLSHLHPSLMECVRVAAGIPLFLSTLRASE